jgi:hypothetical protein
VDDTSEDDPQISQIRADLLHLVHTSNLIQFLEDPRGWYTISLTNVINKGRKFGNRCSQQEEFIAKYAKRDYLLSSGKVMNYGIIYIRNKKVEYLQ